jgi:hypothetical protein
VVPMKYQEYWTCADPLGMNSLQGARNILFVCLFFAFSTIASISLSINHGDYPAFKIHRNQSILLFPIIATQILQIFPAHPRLLFNISTIIPQLSAFCSLFLWSLNAKSNNVDSKSTIGTLSEAKSSLVIPTEMGNNVLSKVNYV